ncbi:hypothetical protein DH2020_014236 [Rehmannia glutinosa]|uniref:Reverse transcriptase n=1 Tax=Rehmannia glutinosa TaxID=99300 RepID=A0ABR0WX89_REHGL
MAHDSAPPMPLTPSQTTAINAINLPITPNVTLCRQGWEHIRGLNTQPTVPWILCADFNEVLSQQEFQSSHKRADWQIRLFHDTLSLMNLTNMGYEGHKFTWQCLLTNPRTQRARLDRALNNAIWRDLFPWSKVIHCPTYFSDHSLLHIQIGECPPLSLQKRRRSIFRFEALWIKSEECEKIIKDSWSTPANNLLDKIEDYSIGLLNWGKQYQNDLMKHVEDLKSEIATLQAGVITNDITHRLSTLKHKLDMTLDQLDLKWRQCVKLHWYRVGDRNTQFFLSHASKRKELNHISSLKDTVGCLQNTPAAIEKIILNHSDSIFTASHISQGDITTTLDRVPSRVSSAMTQLLTVPYTEAEIVKALKYMHSLKSPGPDGMSPIFFKKYWHIIKGDVVSYILNFLNNHVVEPNINFTHIVLIPKTKNPDIISQFRPISLCNVLYKLASKVLANHLRSVLSDIISPSSLLLSRDLQRCQKIHGISVGRSAPTISHLFFADDTLLLGHATVEEGRHFRFAINLFERVSGQLVNLEKSGIVFSKRCG